MKQSGLLRRARFRMSRRQPIKPVAGPPRPYHAEGRHIGSGPQSRRQPIKIADSLSSLSGRRPSRSRGTPHANASSPIRTRSRREAARRRSARPGRDLYQLADTGARIPAFRTPGKRSGRALGWGSITTSRRRPTGVYTRCWNAGGHFPGIGGGPIRIGVRTGGPRAVRPEQEAEWWAWRIESG